LVVAVQGNSEPEADTKALQSRGVMEKVATSREVPFKMDSLENWLQDKKNRSELKKINKALGLKSESDREDELEKGDPNLEDEALEKKVFEQMFSDVSEKQEIPEEELIALADQRAMSIKQYLVEKSQMDSARISLKKVEPGAFTGLAIKLELEAR
jgi:hypothetical protein